MARVQGNELLLDTQGRLLVKTDGAIVTITQSDGVTPATVYAAATGGTTVTQPLTTEDGMVVASGGGEWWLEPGVYVRNAEMPDGRVLDPRRLDYPSGVDSGTLSSHETRLGAVEARDRSGTGSPEGVVSASPGASYQQTDGLEGATSWVKETGTSSTGWRLNRRMFCQSINLYGPEPRAANALACPVSTTYGFPGTALSAHTDQLLSGLNARLRNALFNVIWTPGAATCGVELFQADAGPTNIVQLCEVTGSSATPINSFNVTDLLTPMKSIVTTVTSQGVPQGANNKTIGFRTKGNGAVGPLLYVVRLILLWEV